MTKGNFLSLALAFFLLGCSVDRLNFHDLQLSDDEKEICQKIKTPACIKYCSLSRKDRSIANNIAQEDARTYCQEDADAYSGKKKAYDYAQ